MKKRYPFSLKNWLRAGLFKAFAILLSISLQAQTAPAKLWDKTYGGNSSEQCRFLQQTSDGGYILGGHSESGISGDKSQASKGMEDYWVVKLNASGTKIWDKTYGGSSSDRLTALQQTSDGGYILGGRSVSDISGDKSQASKGFGDYWVIKLDASGNKIWDKTIGDSSWDDLYSLQQTSDGGYILGGTSVSGISGDKSQASKGSSDYWVVKLDASGNKLWDKTIGGDLGDDFNILQQTSDGGYILGGESISGISGDKSQANKGTGFTSDFWVVKLDASGNKIWDKTFGGSDNERLFSLHQTADGGYIFGGISVSGTSSDKTQANYGLQDYWVVKTDASGNKLWDKTFGGSDFDYLNSLKQTSDGGYILGGFSNSGINGNKTAAAKGLIDFWIVKLEANGNKTWDMSIGGNNWDALFSLQQTSDGGYILGGGSSSGISGDKSQASQGSDDFWVVKLGSGVTGMQETEAGFAVSISPNPSQGKFNLQLSNITAPTAVVTVSDLLGRVVLQKEFQATNKQISQELALPNAKGIYLLQLKAGEQIITRKIVVE